MMSSSKIVALFTIVACFAACVSSLQYQINKNLENEYTNKYGAGKTVRWDALLKIGPEGRDAVCRSVHEKTGFGVLPKDGLKEITVQNAFLKFSNPSQKKTFTQILGCKKNNAEEYVYYLAQGLDKDSVMLVFPQKDEQIKGKNVFAFTRRDQITDIPILRKFAPKKRISANKVAPAPVAVASH